MNELDFLGMFKDFVRIAPALVILVWVVLRQEKERDRRDTRQDERDKVSTAALDRSTELHGRSLEALGRHEAHAVRLMDIVRDYIEERRRTTK